ncbi:MAG: hypothetical protein IT293_04555 [Deltaproteobacteria bacterium]|nr:hypothetical protein [Deltaproteobacteria bacterium]
MKAGARLKSAVCATEVIVIAAPSGGADVQCGGAAMLAAGEAAPEGVALDPAAAGGTALGKRYVSASGDLELLCTKPGKGSLAAAGAPLVLKEAKPLPSSD